MGSIVDDRGFNQSFKETKTTLIRAERRNKYFEENIDKNKRNDILEIGCALGELSFFLAKNSNNNVLGIDICKTFIDEAKERYKLPNLEYKLLDVRNHQLFNNRKFDYIIGKGVLHHLYYEMDSVLRILKDMLKDGGKILFQEPNLSNPYCFLIFNTTTFMRKWANLDDGEKAMTKKFINKNLINTGFKNIKIEYKDFLIPLTPYILVKPTIFI
ncbi:MAG: class I SAM-dependent methyltransferase, partial [Bacteroidales bacterium]